MATATHLITEDEAASHPQAEAVVVRFAGDDGDGMMLSTAFGAGAKATKGRPVRAWERCMCCVAARICAKPQACGGVFGPNSSTA